MKRKIWGIFLSLALVFIQMFAFAATQSDSKTITVRSDDLSIYIGEKKVQFSDAAPFTDDSGRTQVPVRFIAEELGYEVDWHEPHPDYLNGAVSISYITTEYKGETAYMSLWLFIESSALGLSYIDGPSSTVTRHWLGGEYIFMDTVAMIKNDRTYIPLRYVAEALGYNVDWK